MPNAIIMIAVHIANGKNAKELDAFVTRDL